MIVIGLFCTMHFEEEGVSVHSTLHNLYQDNVHYPPDGTWPQSAADSCVTEGTRPSDRSEDGSQPLVVSRREDQSGSSSPQVISEGSSQPVVIPRAHNSGASSPQQVSEGSSQPTMISPAHTNADTSPRSGGTRSGGSSSTGFIRSISPDPSRTNPVIQTPPHHVAPAHVPHAQSHAQVQPEAQPASRHHEPITNVFGSFWASVSASASTARAQAEHMIKDPELSSKVRYIPDMTPS